MRREDDDENADDPIDDQCHWFSALHIGVHCPVCCMSGVVDFPFSHGVVDFPCTIKIIPEYFSQIEIFPRFQFQIFIR